MKYVYCILLFFFMVSCVTGMPIIEWNIFSLSDGAAHHGADFVIEMYFITNDFQYALTWFDLISGEYSATLTNPNGYIGLLYRFVEMDEGDLVDADGIWSRTAFDSNFGEDITGDVQLYVDTPLYFGIQLGGVDEDGYGFIQYGWAKLLWDGEGLTLESSALETTGQGIYCGEFRAVPEPGTVGLLLAGGAGVLGMRKRRRNE